MIFAAVWLRFKCFLSQLNYYWHLNHNSWSARMCHSYQWLLALATWLAYCENTPTRHFSRLWTHNEEDETKHQAVGEEGLGGQRVAPARPQFWAVQHVTRWELLKVKFLEAIERWVERETTNQQQQHCRMRSGRTSRSNDFETWR